MPTDLEIIKSIINHHIKTKMGLEYHPYLEGYIAGLHESIRLIEKLEASRRVVHYGDSNDEVCSC